MFEPKSFVSRLLGMGDLKNLMKTIEEAVPKHSQEKMQERLKEGKFSLRDLYEQFQNIMAMGPIEKVKSKPHPR